VLYDEPTTGLDPLTTESVDEMIIHARERLTVTSVVISHDVGSAFTSPIASPCSTRTRREEGTPVGVPQH